MWTLGVSLIVIGLAVIVVGIGGRRLKNMRRPPDMGSAGKNVENVPSNPVGI